ncbi:MAG TPA: hypothetical protein VMB84_14640 [Stellaceae bacterium]|nr:hypothetical protein [Stellaceae bacterium]
MSLREAHPVTRDPAAALAILPRRRERLAIVSTRNRLCGIAAYTQVLERHLAELFEIRVFDLDQYLLRGRHPRLRAQADRHIKEICEEIRRFDAINLQLEYGTLGRSAKDICRRVDWLVRAAPRLSVTFHSLARPAFLPIADLLGAAAALKWRTALDARRAAAHRRKLASRIPAALRREQRRKPVSVIVHNRRDLADARHLFGFERAFDHPLSFLSAAEARSIRSQATPGRFPLLDGLPLDAKMVGVFGFLNNYKGFGTAVRALHQLPPDHHLLVFGATHPNEIPLNQPIHPYVAALLDAGNVDRMLYDQLRDTRGASVTLDIERHFAALFGVHPRDLSQRLHFMGALDDNDFLVGMAICDAVIFPYLEVGQSASGPLSQAVELGCRVIASRTNAFIEFARYHPETIEFFDIGNHLELAQRVLARRQYAPRRELSFDIESNKAVYLAANSAALNGAGLQDAALR